MIADKIHWLGHDAFRIDGPTTIYIDPYQLKGSQKPAGLVLITHDHYDHCSTEDLNKIRREDTIVVTVQAAASKLKGDIRIVQPGDSLVAAGIPIEAVPAYNIGKKFHPKQAGYVGFILTIDGQRIYHAGDTDLIPEMETLEADVALLPVSGTYVMTAEEAVRAADLIEPKLIIPMHYGSIVGSDADATYVAQNSKRDVKVLKRE